MATTRRKLILGSSAGLGLIALGLGGRAATRSPQTAFQPWTLLPQPLADIRLEALRHAILAPNPHNRQPWMVELDGADSMIIRCDLEKRLAETDPFDRQIVIGFGTFLELARIAAAERGYRMDITLFPEGEPQPRLDGRPIAIARFVADPATRRDPLFAAIPRRHSNKEAYDLARPVSPRDASAIAGDGAQFNLDPGMIEPVRETILKAIEIEQTLPRTYMESVRLIRIGAGEVDAQPDGIDLTGPVMELGRMSGLISRDSLADQESTAFKSGLDMLRQTYGSIPALLWITTPGNSRLDQIEAGRRYVRANLAATLRGISMHPMSQSLQEYPEMAEQFRRIQTQLGAESGERVQMLARMGYGPAIDPAPRWPMETHIHK